MSFLQLMLDNLSRYPSKDLLTELQVTPQGTHKVAFTCAAMSALVGQARGFLAAAGVTKGDRVALHGPNSARWVALDLAIMAEGAIVVPLYARQAASELAIMLDDCTPSLVIHADDTLRAAMAEAWGGQTRRALFHEVFAATASAAAPVELAPSDPVTIIYTSGSTGAAKGVVLTRANIDFMLPTTETALGRIVVSKERDFVFHFLPFAFAGSRIMLWTQLRRGNGLMISTDLTKLMDELKAADPSYYLNVPAVLERVRAGVGKVLKERGGIGHTLYEKGLAADKAIRDGKGGIGDKLALAAAKQFVFPKIKDTIGPRLDFLVCGSAPLSPETQHWFELIGIPVYQVYGLTETTAIVTMDQRGKVEAGKVGIAIDGVEMKLTEEAELITRGPHVFAGYWNKPEATAEVIKDGWFYTGDQAEIDSAGNLRVVGRVKNLMKPESGHWIAPEPIEEALRDALPTIEHAVVIGHGRPFLTVLVTGPVTEAEVAAAVETANASLVHYKKIKKFHVAKESMTPESGLLTANGKFKRRAIEAHYKGAIETLYGK
jgi:long-chain acyl-CoA synthetase